MKQYTVYFSEPIAYTYSNQRFNDKIKQWEEVEVTDMVDTITFYSLSAAKRVIKKNMDKYKGSSITKTWANGNWENLGEIKLTGNNKTFVTNCRQKEKNY